MQKGYNKSKKVKKNELSVDILNLYMILLNGKWKKEGGNMIYDLQKASFLKRVSAYILDFILLLVLITGFAFMFSAIFGYDKQFGKLENYYLEYEKEYGIVIDITEEEYEKLTEEEKANYEAADAAFSADEEVIATTNLLFNLTLTIGSLSIVLGFLVLEFIVPLFLRNGQTIGKKAFGIGVMRDDGVRVSAPIMFVRSILGKCTVETLVPVCIILLIFVGGAGIMGLIALLLLLGFEIVLLIKTKTNSAIHDLLSYTVTVDLASQMIFDTKEEMIEYKKKIHAESAEKAPY